MTSPEQTEVESTWDRPRDLTELRSRIADRLARPALAEIELEAELPNAA